MYWPWKNCPFVSQDLYRGHHGYFRVVLEVAAEYYDFLIWHVFSSMTGSHNDTNMLQRSSLFARLVDGHATRCKYEINDHHY
jgi:hypothetical protein